ncbi:MAG: DUF6516 family protein [Archaeoglobaceae archaeon]
MPKTLELLRKSPVLNNYVVLDFKHGENFYFLKIKAELIDNSNLYVREYISENEYIYSYHWQDENGELRIRWDNAPHHKNIKTFPHHKHTPSVEESQEVGFEEVIKVIEKLIGV